MLDERRSPIGSAMPTAGADKARQLQREACTCRTETPRYDRQRETASTRPNIRGRTSCYVEGPRSGPISSAPRRVGGCLDVARETQANRWSVASAIASFPRTSLLWPVVGVRWRSPVSGQFFESPLEARDRTARGECSVAAREPDPRTWAYGMKRTLRRVVRIVDVRHTPSTNCSHLHSWRHGAPVLHC